MEAPDLACAGLHDGLAKCHLAVAGEHGMVGSADRENRRAVKHNSQSSIAALPVVNGWLSWNCPERAQVRPRKSALFAPPSSQNVANFPGGRWQSRCTTQELRRHWRRRLRADRPRECSDEDLASHRDRRPERAGLAGGLRPGQGSTSGATAAAVEPCSRRAGPGTASSPTGRPFGAASSGYARCASAGDAFDTVGGARRPARGRDAARRDAGSIAVGPCGRCLGAQPRRRAWCGAVGAWCCDVGIAIRREGNTSDRFSNGHDARGYASQ